MGKNYIVFKKKIFQKILNPSHLIIASQVLSKNPKIKLEDYAACACSIQNLLLSLASENVASKWSTGKIMTEETTYNIVKINPLIEEIIGFISRYIS